MFSNKKLERIVLEKGTRGKTKYKKKSGKMNKTNINNKMLNFGVSYAL